MDEKSKTNYSSPTPPDFPSYEDTYAGESGVPVHMVEWCPWENVVPKQFFEVLVEQYPVEEESDLRFLLSLAVTARLNQPNQRIIFPRMAIAECIGLSVDRCRNENAARTRLNDFLGRVLPRADMLPYSYKQSKATTVAWNEAIATGILRLRDQPSAEGDWGQTYLYPEWNRESRRITSKRKSERRNRKRSDLDRWNSGPDRIDLQLKLLDYLHGHHGNSFVIRESNYEKARKIGEAYPEATSQERLTKAQALQNLDRVKLDPVPLYHLSSDPNGSVRLSPCQPSLASIPKKMRRALKPNWIELDLSHAHLAIAAGEWELDEIRHELESSHDASGRSIWWDFYDYTGCEAHGITQSVAKSGFKDALYALLYGASPNNIYEAIKESYSKKTSDVTPDLPDNVLEKFGDHWVINRLYGAREKRINELQNREEGIVEDIFGRELHYRPRQHEDIRSVMSKLAQSVELKLLEPVVTRVVEEAERENPRFKVVLWQHDGFSMWSNQPKRWTRNLRDYVDQSNSKYPTRLEVDHPESLVGE